MGYDLVAYLDIQDQDEVTRFIADNGLNPKDYKDQQRIGSHFSDRCTLLEGCTIKLDWHYKRSEACDLHEISCMHYCNFIRDDSRFTNPRFHAALCKRLGKEKDAFPDCLQNICWNLTTREDAVEIADALGEFFPDDHSLVDFADWLRITAKCCSTYELSY
jgi:hypothetical protein